MRRYTKADSADGNENAKKQKSISMLGSIFDEIEDEEADDTTFMQLYASLMILLMTFFIVIFSYSTHSQAKFEMAKQSLYKVFETLGIAETREIISFLRSKLPFNPNQAADDYQQLYVSLAEITEELEEEFGGCMVDLRRDKTTITIPDGKVFDAGELEFVEGAREILTNIVEYIKKDTYTQIIIGGHYYSALPNTRTKADTSKEWKISSLQSIHVAHEFVEQGLDLARISAFGYGSHHPLESDVHTSTGLKDNNRIEIIIKKPISEADKNLELVVG